MLSTMRPFWQTISDGIARLHGRTLVSRDIDHAHFTMPATQGLPYFAYGEPMATMIAERHAVPDTTLVPTDGGAATSLARSAYAWHVGVRRLRCGRGRRKWHSHHTYDSQPQQWLPTGYQYSYISLFIPLFVSIAIYSAIPSKARLSMYPPWMLPSPFRKLTLIGHRHAISPPRSMMPLIPWSTVYLNLGTNRLRQRHGPKFTWYVNLIMVGGDSP